MEYYDDIYGKDIQEQGVKNKKEWVSCFNLKIKQNVSTEDNKELY